MPVPKKRVGHSEQGHRRSNWRAFVPALMTCPQCSAKKRPHMLCMFCGYYDGVKVSTRFGRSEAAT
jgi:large subunit ribosomal protein L32